MRTGGATRTITERNSTHHHTQLNGWEDEVMRESYAHEVELFAGEPADEESVRERLDTALAREWQVLATRTGEVRDDERDHASRLVVS